MANSTTKKTRERVGKMNSACLRGRLPPFPSASLKLTSKPIQTAAGDREIAEGEAQISIKNEQRDSLYANFM